MFRCDWCSETITSEDGKWTDEFSGVWYHDYCGKEFRDELRAEAAALLGDKNAMMYEDDWDGSQYLWDRR